VLGAASIAIVASLDALLCAKVIENVSGQRDNATRQLLCVGAANTVTPLLGGICGSISMSPTTASFRAGGRNSLALFVHATLFLVLVPIVAPLLAHLPQVVVGTLVAHAGVLLFDRWTLQLGRRVVTGRAVNWSSILIDLFVICLVTGVAIVGQVVLAVALGIAIAVVVFTLRMSRGVIRSMRYGSQIQSRRNRQAVDAELLGRNGRHILAIELEGPLFFASAELLHNCIDRAIAEGVRYVILDVTRMNELDSTGARILLQCCHRAQGAGVQLLMCGHEQRAETSSLLRDHSVPEAFTAGRLFPDLDRALESCENQLLRTLKTASATEEDRAFELLDLAHGLAPDERITLKEVLSRREYAAGATVFAQDDSGDALYIILRGSASVRLVDPRGRERRLVTFSAGTVFGEMALIDSQARSATVIADEPLTCYALERAAFERLSISHPRIGMTLLANLARELSLRIRRANLALAEQT
jgi:anti-anti-sigma factor